MLYTCCPSRYVSYLIENLKYPIPNIKNIVLSGLADSYYISNMSDGKVESPATLTETLTETEEVKVKVELKEPSPSPPTVSISMFDKYFSKEQR